MRIDCGLFASLTSGRRPARAFADSVCTIAVYYFNGVKEMIRDKKKQDDSMEDTLETRASSSAFKDRRVPIRETDEQRQLRELIARRAYEIYEERGRSHGEDMNDWLRAEAEVKSKYAAKGTGPLASRARARQ